MITCSSVDNRKNYYNLNYMPQDILKEIALQQVENFTLDDLKTATYYQKCIDFSTLIILGKDGTAMLNAPNHYSDTIETLACVDKQLYATLTDLRNQLNSAPEEKALLKLHYFDKLQIVLPFHDYKYVIEGNERMCNAVGKIEYHKDYQRIALYITGTFYYHLNEHEKLDLPKAMESLENNHSLENANDLLQKISTEGFNNSKPNTQKYLIALQYFNTILDATGSYELILNGPRMSSSFKLLFSSSQTNAKNEPIIPYLLIKKMFTDIEKS